LDHPDYPDHFAIRPIVERRSRTLKSLNIVKVVNSLNSLKITIYEAVVVLRGSIYTAATPNGS